MHSMSFSEEGRDKDLVRNSLPIQMVIIYFTVFSSNSPHTNYYFQSNRVHNSQHKKVVLKDTKNIHHCYIRVIMLKS